MNGPPTTKSLAEVRATDEYTKILGELTQQQRLFVEARLQNMNVAQAGRASGMANPEVNAYKLAKHPKIIRALDAARRSVAEHTKIDKAWVLEALQDALTGAATSTEMTGAIREIAKIIGAYAPEQHVHTVRKEDLTMDKLTSLSEHELLELSKSEGDYWVDVEDDTAAEEYLAIEDACRQPVRVVHEENV